MQCKLLERKERGIVYIDIVFSQMEIIWGGTSQNKTKKWKSVSKTLKREKEIYEHTNQSSLLFSFPSSPCDNGT